MEETLTKAFQNNVAQLEQLLQAKQMEINSLLEVTQSINNNLSADKLFRIYEFTLRGQLGVEKAVVFFNDNRWKIVCNYGTKNNYEYFNIEKEILSSQSMNELKKSGLTIFQEFTNVLPVYHKKTPLAFVFIPEIKGLNEKSKEEKLKFIQTITNIIVVAVENKRLFKRQLEQEAMKKEMELAAQMQALLIPSVLPNDKKIEMSAVYIPHHEIGGDYYDYVYLNKDELVFCIADISGKGIPAALLMANFQANLRACVYQEIPFKQLIPLLNRKVLEIAKGEKFITLFIAKYNSKTRKLSYVNAGHNPSLLYNKKKISYLKQGSTLLGVFEEIPFVNVEEITLGKNAFLVNYTDGLTDTEDELGNRFEEKGVEEFFKKHKSPAPQEFVNQIIRHLTNFKGKNLFSDDITVLCCKIF